MLRKLNLLFASILLTVTYGFSQSGLGTIRGSVIDKDSKEAIYDCIVVIKQNGTVKGNTTTDMDGKFQLNSLTPGSYDVEISNPGEGYQPTAIKGVVINADRITFLDNTALGLPTSAKEIEEVVVVAYKVPLINKDGGPSGATVTREDISRMPTRSAAGVASTVGGVQTDEGSGDISVRGSRSDGTYFFIDGIKVRGSSNLPKSSIEEVSVITGGLPANYGDVTGGIIAVTTRGPSAKYFGSLEGVTSGFYFKGKDPNGYDGKVIGLDKYGYNLVEGLLSGPLLMRKDSTGKKTKPILGFLLSVNYTNELDSRPLNGGSWRIKKEARDYLLENPVRASSTGNGTFSNANYLRASDFEKTAWRMNAARSTLSASAKIDVNTGPSVNLTFGGSLNYSYGSNYDYNNSLLNFTNYGVYNQLDYRVYGRFTQRFSNNKEGSSSKVKSAFYSLMVDYSKTKVESYDKKHKYDLFSYGHVGKFTRNYRTTYEFDQKDGNYYQTAVPQEYLVQFQASQSNAALASITQNYFDLYANDPTGHYETLLQVSAGRALRNGDIPTNVYGIWYNLGTPNNSFGKQELDQFRITGSGSVNVGDHSISLGFEYEQRWDRGWGSGDNGPIGLWSLARLYANSHLTELDKSNPHVVNFGSYQQYSYDRLNTGYAYTSGTGQYGGQENNDQQSFFDYNLRQKLGLNPAGTDYVVIDQYDPSTFSLDMFSADELFNQGSNYISYYGYDHTGKKVKGNTDINKYFNEFDANGNYKRFIGAFQPVYIAGYIMDKFAFKDIVFNVGVRVDVFDANQPVLKDKYLVYTANNVQEARSLISGDPTKYANMVIPSSMGDDYVVYVDDVNNPTKINGFRNGDQWYDANGIPIEDPKLIRGVAGISPWLKNPSAATNSKVSADAFQDYKPQINVMPRIAFSFPISDEASFFAHYDILTKRPTTGVRFNPIDYQFIEARTNTINNPNLKPEQTIDYEIGFQQVLTKTSSLKISAFYREQRNNVQLMNVFEAYPNTYRTYGNRDFGTVKGLTVSYDLRRTGNVRMTAAYTLQFADGTGSDATSAATLLTGLQTAGLPNLRSVFPYSYDQRHNFAITFDYRYGEGADYNGPMIGDAKILENTGLNLITNIYSGSPYTSQTGITGDALLSPNTSGITGTVNGSRLPWQYRLDLQLDRMFPIDFGKEGKKKSTYLQVYLRVTNLFNTMNVLGVYRATGNWNDDGYLAAAQYQTSIQNQLDEQSFRDYYAMKVANPYNISAPRTIRLGVKFDF
ncbi:carboxypeptidase regulatory-like domain-containing protein [Fluviicola sp.]|uniref:carboxypeptidase regulatory-like domain-containing protein n=1 Tax=Fluviicola sp. TaxID=1917219 RepID=UPI0031DDDE06